MGRPMGSLCRFVAVERANPHVLQRIGSEAVSIRRDWMRRADEIDGYLRRGPNLLLQCVQAQSQCARVPHKTLPRCLQ